MTRTYLKGALFITVVLAALVSCRKKTLSSLPGAQAPAGSAGAPEDSVPVIAGPGIAAYSQTARHIAIGANVGGFYEALPPGYDSGANRFPLMVFLHGGGELGDGQDQLPLVLKNAVPKLIHDQTFPLTFTVSDRQLSFVVISPQFRQWPKPTDVEAVVNYAIDHYRVDTHRVYMVGISMGGGATWEYASAQGSRLAAMVPICGASWADSATAKGIAASDVPTWAFHNLDDSSVTYKSTIRYISFIRFFNPEFPVRYTQWSEGGHDAWSKASDPAYREEGKNIYEWMLQYER